MISKCTKNSKKYQQAFRLYTSPNRTLGAAEIAKKVGISHITLKRWRHDGDWKGVYTRVQEKLADHVEEKALEEGLLNIDKIRELQEDLIKAGKAKKVKSKEAAYKTAGSLESLIAKKYLIKNTNLGKGSTILDLLTGNDD